MKEKPEEIRRAYIWGAAGYGQSALEYCKGSFHISGFIDRRADTCFHELAALPVISPQQFLYGDMVDRDTTDIIIAVKYPVEVIQLVMEFLEYRNSHLYIYDGRNIEKPLLYQVQEGEICVPEYMDKRFAEWAEYSVHYNMLNPFVLKLFHAVMDWIGKNEKNITICEIGCGSGQFANMLFDYGYTNYMGIDFSGQAIELAKKANPQYTDKFVCQNAFAYLESNKKLEISVFVLLEVLEHVNQDRELLNMLPAGCTVIFSVPNFKSFNHIRVFDNLVSIQSRYGMLDIEGHIMLPANINNDKIYHLVFATKKERKMER